MVEIRRLKPTVDIAMPRRTSAKSYKGSAAKVVTRRRQDHPSPTPQDTPCVLWQGAVDNHGYGTWHRYEQGQRNKVRPHRWVMEQVMGRPLDPDETILHLCDQPLCYRVSHLRVGTIAENNADMMAKGRYVHAGGRRPKEEISAERMAIRKLYLSGLHATTIAATLGVPISRVRRITRGLHQKGWKAPRPADRSHSP